MFNLEDARQYGLIAEKRNALWNKETHCQTPNPTMQQNVAPIRSIRSEQTARRSDRGAVSTGR